MVDVSDNGNITKILAFYNINYSSHFPFIASHLKHLDNTQKPRPVAAEVIGLRNLGSQASHGLPYDIKEVKFWKSGLNGLVMILIAAGFSQVTVIAGAPLKHHTLAKAEQLGQ